jgi:hypothetical protein
MMMIRCVLMLWGMGTVPFKTGKVKCSVLYEPDWLGDNRTLFADGAFFQVAIGEAKIQSEIAYPGVSTPARDIFRPTARFCRLFPPVRCSR